MVNVLTKWARSRGFAIAWGPMTVLAQVRDDIEARRSAGEIDQAFDRERLSWFRYPEGMPIPGAQSVLMIAVRRPAHTVSFALVEGSLSVVIPPTYVAYAKTREDVRQDLAASVFRARCRLEVLPAPLKAVAARLGLVTYGRNNLAYTARFGSYHQLVGLITDAELAPATGSDCSSPEVLSMCASCKACLRACPTRAIGEDRFLLHAHRCLTYHNESARPWPEHLPASAHHCLVGCMACQVKCPVNAGLLRVEPTGVSFSKDETVALLAELGPASEDPGPRIRRKLETLGIEDYAPTLRRNLRDLLARRERVARKGASDPVASKGKT